MADEITLDPATGKPTASGIFFSLDRPAIVSFDVPLVLSTLCAVRFPTRTTYPDAGACP